jgi:hypothetical protein
VAQLKKLAASRLVTNNRVRLVYVPVPKTNAGGAK